MAFSPLDMGLQFGSRGGILRRLLKPKGSHLGPNHRSIAGEQGKQRQAFVVTRVIQVAVYEHVAKIVAISDRTIHVKKADIAPNVDVSEFCIKFQAIKCSNAIWRTHQVGKV